MRYLLVLLGLMVANVANAIDCRETPNCSDLGFSQEEDPNCLKDGYISCPFDTSYRKCVQHDCEKLGFTKSDKTSWCDEIVTCKDDEKYTLCAKLPSCKIGDVYYADGSCGDVSKYTKDSTPVGVVYWVTDDGRHGKVINLHDLGRSSSSANFDPANPYQTNYKYFEWGSYGKDIPDLTNWRCGDNTDYLTVAKTGDHSHPFWSAGESYTDLIVKALGNDSLKYAAGAAHAFYPPGVLKDDQIVGAGKWYLPTLGELMDLYGYNYTSGLGDCSSRTAGATGTTKTKVNATLQALKDKGAGNAETLTENSYRSSSEYDSYRLWGLNMSLGDRNYGVKNSSTYVRASLAF